MSYNENGNLSRILGAKATSGRLLPAMQEGILTAGRRVDPNIIDATGEQRWHCVHVHSVYLEQYGRELGGKELIQWEIEGGADSVMLAWTP